MEGDMTLDKGYRKLEKDEDIRAIKLLTENNGPRYLVETIDTNLHEGALSAESSPFNPSFSWKQFSTPSEAEADAKAQYEASLKEGFKPVS
jgi:hypothetical protein